MRAKPALRSELKIPLNNSDYVDTSELRELVPELIERITARSCVEEKKGVRAVNVAMKSHPVADPFELVVLIQREKNALVSEQAAQVLS
jgi:histone acetyltransferase (RNA polymerase elongator complex component)